MDGWMDDEWMNGCIDGWMKVLMMVDGWIDG